MLSKTSKKRLKARGARFAIVASRFNAKYVDSMLKAARKTLAEANAKVVDIFRVPGSFEIPVIAARLAESNAPSYDAIICLGVVLRGETTHAQHITEAVCQALADLQVTRKKPVINGVYLFENHEQAYRRCLDPELNRGLELAQTAVAMATLMEQLPTETHG